MEAIEVRAYEIMGYWTIVVIHVHEDDSGHLVRTPVYRAEHNPIDETDPLLRAVLLLSQVERDLNWQLQQEAMAAMVVD